MRQLFMCILRQLEHICQETCARSWTEAERCVCGGVGRCCARETAAAERAEERQLPGSGRPDLSGTLQVWREGGKTEQVRTLLTLIPTAVKS